MSSPLPERYQRYAAPAGQRPTYPAAVELVGEREAAVWVPSAERPGEMVAIPKSCYVQGVQGAPLRDLAPQPLLDPGAQKILATGVGVGFTLWGGGHFLVGASALVSAAAGGVPVVIALALLLLATRFGGKKGGDTYNVTNNNRWWGRSSTRL
ncbi:hypothetical protein ABZY36_35395 [Streptomyces sp. NPDC006627]|uniref:hypothetical protein n=1 Tax=Streptomyces sp. NPDC006627 TaxID=3154679 RepID=UPI0033BA04CF